jgi:glycosyltransferase involved in cell wall biosynthesis
MPRSAASTPPAPKRPSSATPDEPMARSASEKISAVIACHGDGPAVPTMHERLTKTFRSIGVDYEIIFVNDGSPDNAAEVLAELAGKDRKVTVITHSRAFGSQAAFTSGMRIATGDAVVLFDGDLQDPPELMTEFVERWREGYQVVYGERVEREMGWALGTMYKLFYRLFRRVSYVNVPLDAGDFSLIDRRAVDALNSLPEKQRFIRGLRAWIGFRQTGVPYRRPERPFGRSTNSLIKNLGWARRAIVSFSYAPLDLLTWLGILIVLAAFIGSVATVVLKLINPGVAPQGLTTVLLVVMFLGGVQLLAISVIGSYLAHMYDEVKARPSYLVDEVLNPPGADDPAPTGVPTDPGEA